MGENRFHGVCGSQARQHRAKRDPRAAENQFSTANLRVEDDSVVSPPCKKRKDGPPKFNSGSHKTPKAAPPARGSAAPYV